VWVPDDASRLDAADAEPESEDLGEQFRDLVD
jgi:hypothetical protein